jgi:KDO2-lipid IV(A) lauroyltransferase
VVKKNEPLGFMLDQNMKKNWGVFVDFFGKPASTSDGLAQLSAMSGYHIHPILCRRDPQTRKLIAEVGEQIPGPKDRSDEEILRVTAECTHKIEEFIRSYPDQWIWMHRRWKTQQPLVDIPISSSPSQQM